MHLTVNKFNIENVNVQFINNELCLWHKIYF